jgi:hypothetical protein
VIYGDVVITGPPQRGEATEVDPALVDYFSCWNFHVTRWQIGTRAR